MTIRRRIPVKLPLFLWVLSSWLDPAPSLAQPPDPPAGMEWVQVWSDEFAGAALDTTKWGFRPERLRARRKSGGMDIDWRYESDNVSFENGNLVLTNTRTRVDASTWEVHAAAVASLGIYERTYGYFEARIKIAPVASGVHTAFWLQNYDRDNNASNGGVDGAADGAEIDIMESPYTNNKFDHAIHWDGDHTAYKTVSLPIHDGQYHVFAVEWNDSEYRFYADGDLTWTYTGEGVSGADEFIILSTGVSWAGGNVPNGTFPNHALVDWIRVYELQASTSIAADPPVVDSIASDAAHPANGPFTLTIAFSEPVTGLTVGDISVTNGAASNLAGTGSVYTVTISPDADFEGDVTVTIPADAAEDASNEGNVEAEAAFAVDTRAPVLHSRGGAADKVDADLRRGPGYGFDTDSGQLRGQGGRRGQRRDGGVHARQRGGAGASVGGGVRRGRGPELRGPGAGPRCGMRRGTPSRHWKTSPSPWSSMTTRP